MIMEAARARGCRSVVMNSKTKTTKRIQHDFRAGVTRPTRISHRQDLSALLWRDFAEGSLELNGHAMDHEEAESHKERQHGGKDVRLRELLDDEGNNRKHPDHRKIARLAEEVWEP